MNEIWKDIKNYEGIYQISNMGRIKSIEHTIIRKDGKKLLVKEKILKQSLRGKNNNKYYHITLQGKCFRVNRLIAETFISNPNNLPCVNHKDENPSNNCVDNLEWCNYSYNTKYGTSLLKGVEKHYKPVLQYDMNGNFIKEWKGIRFANEELNIATGAISKCCRGINNTVKGFVWKYKN